jgi:anti-sigma B factor antagonist
MTGGTVTMVIRGELDLASSPALAARLSQLPPGEPRRLVFDMTGVSFIDCAAARLIADTARLLPAGQRPVVLSPRQLVRRVLDLTGLADQCEIRQ